MKQGSTSLGPFTRAIILPVLFCLLFIAEHSIAVRSTTQAHAASRHKLKVNATARLWTQNELSLGMEALLMEQAKVRAGGEPSCQGLPAQMCAPCPQGGPADFCAKVDKMCKELFCSPFCRRQTWKCSVSFGGLSEEAGDPQYGQALCGQFIAYGCQKMLDCCPDDENLYDFVENNAFMDQYPDSRFPTPSCTEGPNAKLCGKCKAAVKVTLTPLSCPYPKPEGKESSFLQLSSNARNRVRRRLRDTILRSRRSQEDAAAMEEDDSDEEEGEGNIDSGEEEEEEEEQESLSPFVAAQAKSGDFGSVFVQTASRMRAQVAPPTGFKDGMFPGPPKHKAINERCTKLEAKVKAKLGAMKAAFQENACKCMGCCEGECFYPVTEKFPAATTLDE